MANCWKELLTRLATDSSHRVIMGKRRYRVFSKIFSRILFIFAGNDDIHKSLDDNYMEGSGSATIK